MHFKTCLVLSLFICLSLAELYPIGYKQNDYRWKNNVFGFDWTTIGEDGSLLCSIASVVGGLGRYYDYKYLFDPIYMDIWLKNHGGYIKSDQIVWESLTPLGLEFTGFTTDYGAMINGIMSGNAVIFEIKGENRYVVGYRVQGGMFYCMDPDPSFPSDFNYYSISEIARAGIYKVSW